MIKLKIDVKKISKNYLYPGEKGLYLELALFEKPSEYGDDGFVSQGVPKEMREKDPDLRGPIVGNWRNWETKKAPTQRAPVTKPPAPEDDDIPW